MPKIFISYRRAEPDIGFAAHLEAELEKLGHEVFRDVDTPIGQRWAEQIAQELSSCDYFVILISELSMNRDMVRQEMQQVYALNQKHKKPIILPVRLAYKGALPYDMAAWLDPLQYALWENTADNDKVVKQLAAAIAGSTVLPHQQTRTTADQIELIRSTEDKGCPLPKAEPVLDVIALTADNPFYVTREVDESFYGSLRWDNGVATLHAARQMGKSSMFARIRARLEKEGLKSAFIDLKPFATEPIPDAGTAFEAVAGFVVDQLGLEADPAAFFSIRGFAAARLQRFLIQAVAPLAERVVLFFDDIDSIFETPYRDAFFAGLRTVIDAKPANPPLRKIGFAFAHSHDPGHWIKSANQSPFNVAKTFLVPEFNRDQFDWLHQQHGAPLAANDQTALFEMLGGHPYLTRLALYRISTHEMTFDEVKSEADSDEGIFGDHLRSRLWNVINGGLAKPLKSILDTGQCADIMQFQSLLAMGIVKGKSHRAASARFGLYCDYFKSRLDA